MITINIIIYSFILFIIIFFLHIIIWRTIRPKKQIIYLLAIFIFIPILLVTVLLFYIKMNFNFLQDLILIFLLYFALAGVYIQTYPAIQAWSPSLFFIYLIGKNKNGININNISNVLNQKNLITDRFNDLKNDDLITISNNKIIILTNKGKFLVNLFIIYRRFLGLKEGEG